MAIDIKAVLLETILSPTSTEAEKKQAQAALDRTTAKPVKPSPTEDTSTSDKYFRDFEVTNRAHLIEEAKYPEPIAVLKKCGQQLFSAASDYVWKENPTTAQGDRDRLILPTIIAWMNNPPEDVKLYVESLKSARRYLNANGLTWPIGGLDWLTKDDPHCPYRDQEAQWYAEPEEAQGD